MVNCANATGNMHLMMTVSGALSHQTTPALPVRHLENCGFLVDIDPLMLAYPIRDLKHGGLFDLR